MAGCYGRNLTCFSWGARCKMRIRGPNPGLQAERVDRIRRPGAEKGIAPLKKVGDFPSLSFFRPFLKVSVATGKKKEATSTRAGGVVATPEGTPLAPTEQGVTNDVSRLPLSGRSYAQSLPLHLITVASRKGGVSSMSNVCVLVGGATAARALIGPTLLQLGPAGTSHASNARFNVGRCCRAAAACTRREHHFQLCLVQCLTFGYHCFRPCTLRGIYGIPN